MRHKRSHGGRYFSKINKKIGMLKMKKIAFMFLLAIVVLFLMNLISYAIQGGRIEITGLKTGCPSGLSLLISGNKRFCEIKDSKIIDVYIESAKGRSRCPDGYVSDIYGDTHWCTKRKK